MNFYQNLGPLVLGTRLKRLSEYFLSELNQTYAQLGIPFEASWFGVFYLLDSKKELTMAEIAEKLEISHSAVSQLLKSLQDKELVQFNKSHHDARKKILAFTPKGQKLLEKVKPVWIALGIAISELLNETQNEMLFTALIKIESAFESTSLHKRIKNHV